jgi:redox-sensitive bicupin YhaK (pirin superfamily)
MSSLALRLSGHEKDLGGGFVVRRLLPSAQRQSIGPFLFFDHFGPVRVEPSSNYDVRPHPHIGLATVTYLFEGAIMHRDSLGSSQQIEPGAVNWMTAGRGIVHSERRPEQLRGTAYVNHGLQLWAALPAALEETEPKFSHTPASAIPVVRLPGAAVRLLVGDAFGLQSPVEIFSPTLYLDIDMQGGAVLSLPPLTDEMAIYVVEGGLEVDLESVAARTLVVLQGGGPWQIACDVPSRFVVFGGAPLDGHRTMWWNFVSSRKERVVQAAADWENQAMGKVAGEDEFIPLPERRFVA